MLLTAQQAKDNLLAVQRIVRKAMGLSRAFHAGAVAGGVTPVIGAYPSQDKQTLRHYSQEGTKGTGTQPVLHGTPGGNQGWTCFGHGGNYAWSEF